MNANAFVDRAPLSLDRDRVTCLLLLNAHLMKKAINIYHSVLCNQEMLKQMPEQERVRTVESYQHCTRRIHCNLSVLNHLHDKYHGDPLQQTPQQNRTTFPIMLSAPPDMPELTQLYTKLQELYPEAMQFIKMRIQQMRSKHMQQQQLQQQQQPQQIPQQDSPHQSLQQQQNMQQQQFASQQQRQQQQQQQQQQKPEQVFYQKPDSQKDQSMYNNGYNSVPRQMGNAENMPTPSGRASADFFVQSGLTDYVGPGAPSARPQQSQMALSPQQILQQAQESSMNTPGDMLNQPGNLDFF